MSAKCSAYKDQELKRQLPPRTQQKQYELNDDNLQVASSVEPMQGNNVQ